MLDRRLALVAFTLATHGLTAAVAGTEEESESMGHSQSMPAARVAMGSSFRIDADEHETLAG